MTFLFCESSPNFGGQEQQILLQMAALRTRGAQCILACAAGSEIAKAACQRNLPWEDVAFRNSFHLPSILAIFRMIRQHSVDVIMCHSGHDANSAGMARRLTIARKPVLIRTRTYLASAPRRSTINSAVDLTFVPSEFLRNAVLENPEILTNKIQVLHPLVPLDSLEADSQLPLPDPLQKWIDSHSPVISQVAMLRSEKGHRLALKAIAHLREKHPNIGFVIAGSGVKEKDLRKQTESLGLNDHVRFVGTMMPVAPLIARSDLIIMPSRYEPLGLAQLEALALGVPVVVSDAGGLPETVFDGKTGWVLPFDDLDAWKAHLHEAISDRVESQRRAIAGKKWVMKTFSTKSHLAALDANIAKISLRYAAHLAV